MEIHTRQLLHLLIFVIGLVLIIGGITRHANGAWIIGLIVAAVNFRQLLKTDRGQGISH